MITLSTKNLPVEQVRQMRTLMVAIKRKKETEEKYTYPETMVMVIDRLLGQEIAVKTLEYAPLREHLKWNLCIKELTSDFPSLLVG
ncbi:MAG: hypothetical protein HYT94_02855 [Parcubacteria group bacterium]|nr:hypothetical protein [Parcubacteria group bacterium]